MNMASRTIGWLATIVLVLLSLYSILSTGEVGSQSWIYLLLIPFAASLALSHTEKSIVPTNSPEEWEEDEETEVKKNVEAGEFGFDTPIL
jgi:hypothetical protein|tara:strand:+ start:578 stop:847 length:270 start_codon:yes stop_codon:yes gene_type:complete